MAKDRVERKEKRIKLEDCSAKALSVAIDFMYGIDIPIDFTGLTDLLHISDLFMMENLTEVVVQRFVLTNENYLAVSQAADLYNTYSLVKKCADFIYENLGEGLKWDDIGKLPKVMVAFGERAKGKSCWVNLKAVKKREDYGEDIESEELYAQFVYETVQKGSMVRVRCTTFAFSVALPLTARELKEGDVGIVRSKDEDPYGSHHRILVVQFGKQKVQIRSRNVEVLA